VLLDNAARHGQGKVEIAVDTVDDNWAEITVSDEGPGFALDEQATFQRRSTDTDGHGIGLALARSLAHAEGGRLAIPNRGPAPRITLTLRTSTSPSLDHQGSDPSDLARRPRRSVLSPRIDVS